MEEIYGRTWDLLHWLVDQGVAFLLLIQPDQLGLIELIKRNLQLINFHKVLFLLIMLFDSLCLSLKHLFIDENPVENVISPTGLDSIPRILRGCVKPILTKLLAMICLVKGFIVSLFYQIGNSFWVKPGAAISWHQLLTNFSDLESVLQGVVNQLVTLIDAHHERVELIEVTVSIGDWASLQIWVNWLSHFHSDRIFTHGRLIAFVLTFDWVELVSTSIFIHLMEGPLRRFSKVHAALASCMVSSLSIYPWASLS